jgi:hypothetical protein
LPAGGPPPIRGARARRRSSGACPRRPFIPTTSCPSSSERALLPRAAAQANRYDAAPQ